MSTATELFEAIRKLTAVEMRSADIQQSLAKVENKLDSLLERLTRLEAHYEHLKEHLRSDIMADIKADLAVSRVYLDLQSRGLLGSDSNSPPGPHR